MREPQPTAQAPAATGENDRSPERAAPVDSRRILGMRVDATSYEETAATIAALASKGAGGYVCIAAVNNAIAGLDDPGFRRAMNAADRVTPDGVPLVWALRWLGIPGATRVYGPSLTPAVCERARDEGLCVGFLGGSPEVLDAMVQELVGRFPGLSVAFTSSPPFRELSEDEDEALVGAIEASGVHILFVGLGCPKQERWMAAHRDRLRCVMVGVGAAFDFLAGRISQAPAPLQRAGLEWLYRLAREPRRLWRRYLVGNPRFVYHFARERIAARGGDR